MRLRLRKDLLFIGLKAGMGTKELAGFFGRALGFWGADGITSKGLERVEGTERKELRLGGWVLLRNYG